MQSLKKGKVATAAFRTVATYARQTFVTNLSAFATEGDSDAWIRYTFTIGIDTKKRIMLIINYN